MFEFFLFGVSVVASLAAWGYVSIAYIWPRLRPLGVGDAARPLVVLHLFRFVGASFLIAGVAGTGLAKEFAAPGAYGDLIAMALAWIALARLNRAGGAAALWIFNIWGAADLIFAFYKGGFDPAFQPGYLGATFYIVTFYVPLLMCSHIMMFVLLRRSRSAAASNGDRTMTAR